MKVVLPMVSVLPEDSLERLRHPFGAKFNGLEAPKSRPSSRRTSRGTSRIHGSSSSATGTPPT